MKQNFCVELPTTCKESMCKVYRNETKQEQQLKSTGPLMQSYIRKPCVT